MKTPAILVIACCAISLACTETKSEPAATAANCDSEFTRDQFVGTWTEDGSTGLITLNADGTMTNSAGSGTWEFTRWATTPSPAHAGDENACVLWLKLEPLNLVYGALAVTERKATLTYIGRGNTISWTRSPL